MTRKPGTYELEELISTVDGHTAYRVADPDTAGSWERAQVEPSPGISWVIDCDDEPDDLDVSLTVDAYARLVARAATHCPCCDGRHPR